MNTTNGAVITTGDFKQKIGLVSAILLTLGSITGSGIYVLVGIVEGITGPAIILAFGIDLFIALLIAGCYAECASLIPKSGGGFVYMEEAFGRKALFIGWIVWLSNMAYASINAFTVGEFIRDLLGIETKLLSVLIGTIVVFLFSYLNARGSDTLSKFQNPLVVALLVTYIVGAIYLFKGPPRGSFIPFMPYGITSVIMGSGLLLDVFIGFEDISSISEEIKSPEKNVPKALFYSIYISAAFFFLVIIAVQYALPQDEIAGSTIPFLDAIKGSKWIYFVTFIGAVFALITSAGVGVMASSRNLYALAKSDFIDRKWAEINSRFNVPMKSVYLSAFLAVLILISGEVELITSISNVSYIVSVIFLAFTIIKFRKTRTYPPGTYKLPFFPYSIILALISNVILLIFFEISAILVTVAWFLIGLAIYFFFSSKTRVVGTIFLVVSFLILLTNIIVGIIVLAIGILFYFFKIMNINSTILTLAGMKLFGILGSIIMVILSTRSIKDPFIIILSITLSLAMLSFIFDIISINEILHFFERKRKDSNVPIQLGNNYIVILSEKMKKFLQKANSILYFSSFIAAFVLILLGLIIIFNFIVDLIFPLNQIQDLYPINWNTNIRLYLNENVLTLIFTIMLWALALILILQSIYHKRINRVIE